MFSKLLTLALALLLPASAASAAGDLTDAEILALAGPRTCEFGQFPDKSPREVSIPIIPLDPNVTYEYCFRLPRLHKSDLGVKTSGFVTLYTANLSNSTCGTATTYLIRPNRKPLIAPKLGATRAWASIDVVQPGGVLYYTPGVWRVLIRGESGFQENCNKYKVTATW